MKILLNNSGFITETGLNFFECHDMQEQHENIYIAFQFENKDNINIFVLDHLVLYSCY